MAASATARFDFRMLGPLEVSGPMGLVDLGGPKQQAVLALLLLRANDVVPVDVLLDEIWPGENPLNAKTSLHSYVSRLRKTFGERIETHPNGYSLRVDSLELDRVAFERQADLAQEALGSGNADLAFTRLGEGLRLWRDRPLRGIPLAAGSEIEINRLAELHLTMLEQEVEALLALGRNRDALAQLEPLVGHDPYRERLRELLMVALYRSGRQADALAEFRAVRELLVRELGIEPGPALRELQRMILAHDPGLDLPGKVRERSARRQVTVLLAVFRPAADPEALRQSAADATKILQAGGAHVEDRPGEGVLGVFGVPATREDDALRSLRSAADLIDSVPGVAHVAIESGEVLSEGERALGGEPLARVGQLSQEAKGREILLGEGTQSAVRHYARMGPPTRGGARRLVGIDPGAEAIQRHLEGALVGREVELGRLEQAFKAAIAERECHLVTVFGNPGIGKSKLSREFGERVSQRGTVLEGRCPSFGEGITLWPLAQMVRNIAGNLKRNTLQGLLEDDPDAALIARQLATALGTEDVPEAAEDTFWALRELFEMLAGARPLILVFEDLHWGKPSLLDLIEQLVDFWRGGPILIICLARLELLSQRPAWGGGRRNASTILLNPLSEAESRVLVQARSETISELNAEGIVERAEGNPLFIEQLLALLEESGELRPGAMPPSIQGVLAARLDRIEPDEREVLDHGAVIGLEFWAGAIATLTQRASEEVDELLIRLTEKEFLRPAPSELQDEEAYRFRHGLLRDVDYQSVPKAIRADVHERFAKWLKDSHPDEGDSDEVAGHHLEQAYRYCQELDVDESKAQALALEAGLRFRIAGSRVLLRSDMAAASRLLEKALDLWPPEHPERGEILSMFGPACRAMGQWTKAERAVDEGLRFAERHNDEVLKSQLRIRRLETRLQQGGLSVREAEKQAKVEIERLKLAGAAYEFNEGMVFVAWLRALQGQATEAEKTLRELLGSTRLAPHVRLRALRLLPSQWLYGPLPAEEGIARCRHLLTRQELGHRELAALHRSLAALTAMQGNLHEARALIADEEEKLSSLGLALVSAGALLVRAEIEMIAGEMQAAEMLLREGLRRLQALGETLIAAEFSVCLARVVALRGDLDESWELARASTDVKTFDVAVPVQRNSTTARILAQRGLHADAVDQAHKATQLALKTDLVNLQADAFRDLGDVIQISMSPAKARPPWKRALLLYELKGNALSAAEIKRRLKP